jgi:hypothetical protein
MPDPLDGYLDEVMTHAGLAPADARRVRGELKEHLQQIVATTTNLSDQEVITMLKNEFGEPTEIGNAIASAKGRFRTYLKKRRRFPIQLAIALIVALSVRYAVAEAFYVPSSAAAPQIPQGSRCIVYKLASTFRPGDVIVFRGPDGHAQLAVVRDATDPAALLVTRSAESDQHIARSRVIGRVVLNTR